MNEGAIQRETVDLPAELIQGIGLLSKGKNPELERAAKIVIDLFDCASAFVAFPSGDRLWIKGTAGQAEGTLVVEWAGGVLDLAGARVCSAGDVDDPCAMAARDIDGQASSIIIAPLSAGTERSIGFVCAIRHRDRPPFDPTDADRLGEFAAFVSTGIGAFVSEYAARQAQDARVESERRLRALLESFPDLIFRISREGHYRDVHAPSSDLLAARELLGRRLHDVLPHDLAEAFVATIRAAIEGQALQSLEYDLDTIGKGTRHFEARVMPCADDEVVFTVRDVTERRETALRLAARESLLDSVMRATIALLTRPSLSVAVHDAFAIIGQAVDVDRVYYFENHRDAAGRLCCSQRFEWTNDLVRSQETNPDLQGMSYDEYFPEWRLSMERGRPVTALVRELEDSLRASFEEQEIRAVLLVPILQNGEFIGFVGFDDCRQERQWSDIEISVLTTAAAALGGAIVQRKARFEIGNSRARYKALVDNVNDVIFQTDASGTLVFVSHAWTTVSGRAVKESVGRRLRDLVAAEDADVLDRCQHALLHERIPECRHDVRIVSADGSVRWVQLYARASFTESGDAGGIFGTLHDVTERRRYEDALVAAKERAEEMAMLKSSFLANMSHEIRTPLTSILGFSQILAEEVEGEQAEMIDLIVRNGKRLMETLNSVLELARLESRDVRLRINPVRLDQEVEEIVRLFGHRTIETGVSLRHEIRGPATCHTDASIVRRILSNLVGNALKFTVEGEVVIHVDADDEVVRIAVRDTGIGIEEDFLESLFDDFTQESSGLDRSFEGAGLGLAITRRMVTIIGAKIHVESTKGSGSTFTVTIPRKPPRRVETDQDTAFLKTRNPRMLL